MLLTFMLQDQYPKCTLLVADCYGTSQKYRSNIDQILNASLPDIVRLVHRELK